MVAASGGSGRVWEGGGGEGGGAQEAARMAL